MTRAILAFVLLLASDGFAATDIGVAAAVRGSVKATAPGGPAGRAVETGKPVYQNDAVVTGADSKLQILLLDETGFTVGPNSEMTLDEFVFDPATSAGKVSATVKKGAFRFSTGKVARRDPTNMKVGTPVATIGIRGTMVAGSASESEATIVLLGPGPGNNADEKGGAFTVANQFGSTEVDKDGWGVTIKAGQAPGEPFELGPGQLDGILNQVASAPKGDSADGSGSGDKASEQSGQDTAEGKSNLGDAFATYDSAQSDASAFASQQFAGFKTSKWDDVRGIQSGTARYTGSDVYYNCTGGTCQSTPAGTATLGLDIDFGARTIGGTGSTIVLTNPSTTGTINQFSFSSLTGDAATSITLAGFGNWTGTSLKLLDAAGVTAASASVDIRFIDTSTSQSYQGEVTGNR
ncbi:MAG: FecR family protein [Elusimicrobiota bacterium]|nr:FecR family protein [Elusimicrobiota bacterium]